MRLVGGVLGAVVGSFFGAPQIGWAIGSLIGGAFEKKEDIINTGPRLDDLAGPTSGIVGTQIPITYGTDRVAGGIIWASNIKETKHETSESSGGKDFGGPEVITKTFTYSVNFAVGIGEGVIGGIRKIWANKAIIYDLDGTESVSKVNLDFQIYYGTETQMPDPTIEAYEGVGNTSAHRGLAYIVFRNFQLAEFGNRVPMSLEFEIVAQGTEANIASRLYTSPALYMDDIGPSLTYYPYYTVQSPNTGIIWMGHSGVFYNDGDINGGTFAIGINTSGQHVRDLLIDTRTSGGDPLYKHYALSGHYFNSDGSLMLTCVCSWVENVGLNTLNYGIKVYDEFGNFVKDEELSGVKRQGSNFWWNPDPPVMADDCYVFQNSALNNNCIIAWVSSREVANIDGTVDYSHSIRTHSNTSEYTINNSDFAETYTQDLIISNNCFRIYEDDDYGLLTRPISLAVGNNAEQRGRVVWTIDKQNPSGTTFTSVVNVDVADLIHNIYFDSGSSGIGEVILENGDSYFFYLAKETGDTYKTIHTWYKTDAETDYNTYVGKYSPGYDLGNLANSSITIDRKTSDILLFSESLDKFFVFNVYSREWSTENVTGWNGGTLSFEHILFNTPTSPYLYIANVTSDTVKIIKIGRNVIGKDATTLGYIVSDICDRANIDSGDIDTSLIDALEIKGFSIRRHNSGKAIITTILPTYLVDPVESEWELKFKPFGTTTNVISNSDLGAVIGNGNEASLYTIDKREEEELPKAIALQYSGYLNNYLRTQQSATRNGFIYNYDNSQIIELPVVLEDDFAAKLTEKMLYILFISATTFKITIPKKYSYLEPTDLVSFYVDKGNEVFTGKITKIDTDSFGLLEIEGERYYTDAINSYATGVLEDNEQIQIIPLIGYMYVQPIDFRPLYEVEDTETLATSIYIVGGGYIDGWEAGQVFYSFDGSDFKEYVYIDTEATFGVLTSSVGEVYNYNIMDHKNTFTISITGGIDLASITDDQMKTGLNTMIILSSSNVVKEVLQFKTISQNTGNNYTVSDLWRFRYNTYDYSAASSGDKFVVVTSTSLYQKNISANYIDVPIYMKGASLGQIANDIRPVSYTYQGNWLKNPKPRHVRTAEVTLGDVDLEWKPISRFAGDLMFSDPVSDQTIEQFRIEVYDLSATLVNTYDDITTTSYTYDISADGLTQGDYMMFRVYQYSDVHSYDTEYAEVDICTLPDTELTNIATPILYLKFNEIAGVTTLVDSSTSSNDLTKTSGTALHYKGNEIVNRTVGSLKILDYARYTTDSNVFASPDRDISHSVWLRLNRYPDADVLVLNYSGNSRTLSLRVETDGIIRYLVDNAYGQDVGPNSLALVPGRIYHIATTTSGDISKIYVNGSLRESRDESGSYFYGDGDMYLGLNASQNIDIDFGEVMVFSTALSATEIEQLYRLGRAKSGGLVE